MRSRVKWQIQHKTKPSAVFATKPHPSCYILLYNTSNDAFTNLLVLVEGLIASTLNLGLGEWIHKDAKQTN